MTECLGICAVRTSTQRRAQRDIERLGFGTRMPSYRVTGERQVQLRPIFPGLIFTHLSPGWGVLNDIEGVRVLANQGQPLRIIGRDEDKLASIELACLMGEFNKKQSRNTAGRYVSAPVAAARPKKRRCRSITARADRRRRRRAKRRGTLRVAD